MSNNWTPDQLNAIQARGGSLLVSAAAGSGKTAVLVERVIGRILDDNPPVDIDRLLVVTFSKASAAEMRSRVAKRIRERLKVTPMTPICCVSRCCWIPPASAPFTLSAMSLCGKILPSLASAMTCALVTSRS